MKRISVREFQLKPYECLKELPIMLTRYDKDVAVIQRAVEFIKIKKEDIEGSLDVKVEKGSLPIEDTRPMFSDGPQEGYHFSETIGKYIKDEF